MAGSLNKVMLIGNLGRDPEIRSTQDGREIATLNIATSETWKDKSTGERREKTEWHRVVAFSDGLVNIIKNYLHKGSKVFIEGSLQTRKWTDNNGVEKYSTEVVLQGFNGTLTMLDAKGSNSGSSNYNNNNNASNNDSGGSNDGGGGYNQQPAPEKALDDEIPF